MIVKMYEVVYGVSRKGIEGKEGVVWGVRGTHPSPQRTPSTPRDNHMIHNNLSEVIATIASNTSHPKYMYRKLCMNLCVQLLRDLHTTLFERNSLPSVLRLYTDYDKIRLWGKARQKNDSSGSWV